MDLLTYHIESGFRIDDPYAQSNLSPLGKFDASSDGVNLLNFYRVSGEKVFCHICAGKRHWSGFTGEVPNGKRILFGSKCAKDYFGKDIATKAFAEFRRKIKKANAKFAIFEFKNSIEPLEQWLISYTELVNKTQDIWDSLFWNYEEPTNEILSHLRRNEGRVVIKNDTLIGYSENRPVYQTHSEILFSVSGHTSISYLTRLKQRISQLQGFCTAVRNFDFSEDLHLYVNINSYFRKSLMAAKEIDDALTFTHDFFQENKLSKISDWLERNRLIRLSTDQAKKRDYAKLVRRIAGSGFPNVDFKVADAVSSCVIPQAAVEGKAKRNHEASRY